jgi:hypothetical protein
MSPHFCALIYGKLFTRYYTMAWRAGVSLHILYWRLFCNLYFVRYLSGVLRTIATPENLSTFVQLALEFCQEKEMRPNSIHTSSGAQPPIKDFLDVDIRVSGFSSHPRCSYANHKKPALPCLSLSPARRLAFLELALNLMAETLLAILFVTTSAKGSSIVFR